MYLIYFIHISKENDKIYNTISPRLADTEPRIIGTEVTVYDRNSDNDINT